MTCLAVQSELCLAPQSDVWNTARTSVFWGFILLVIASPAALGLLILLRG